MEHVTVDQLKEAISTYKIAQWSFRECLICTTPLRYLFHNGEVYFDGNCDCVTYSEPPQPRSLEHIIEFLNRQTSEVRQRLWNSLIASGAK